MFFVSHYLYLKFYKSYSTKSEFYQLFYSVSSIRIYQAIHTFLFITQFY